MVRRVLPNCLPDSFELSFEHNTTVRELIRRTVEENAKAQMRQSRRHLHQEMAAISQGALTDQQIREQAAKGKVGMPTAVSFRRKLRRSHIDVSAQVRRAWKAFEKRDFLLTVDASITREPGKQAFVFPAGTRLKDEKLFLPFADEDDELLSAVCTAVLLLSHDDQIKDKTLLCALGVSNE